MKKVHRILLILYLAKPSAKYQFRNVPEQSYKYNPENDLTFKENLMIS